MTGQERVPTDAATLRRMFNEGDYWGRVQRGDLVAGIKKQRHPAPPPAGQPTCTFSQVVYYFNPSDNTKVAVAHQYLLPNGSLGASGKPDPKAIVEAGVMYILTEPPDQR